VPDRRRLFDHFGDTLRFLSALLLSFRVYPLVCFSVRLRSVAAQMVVLSLIIVLDQLAGLLLVNETNINLLLCRTPCAAVITCLIFPRAAHCLETPRS